MTFLKALLGLVLVIIVAGCSPLHQHVHEPELAQEAPNLLSDAQIHALELTQTLEHGIENELWVQKLYKKYQLKGGYKALAMASPNKYYIDALGFSTGMLSADLARQQALLWCDDSNKGASSCKVVLQQAVEYPYPVSDADIRGAPSQLISYESLLRLKAYQQSDGHKAFAIATNSVDTHWASEQKTQREARSKVLSMCQKYKSRIADSCEILFSE